MTKSQKAQAQKALHILQAIMIDGKTQGDFMEIENIFKEVEKLGKRKREELDTKTLANGMKTIETRTADIPAKAAYTRESQYKVWTY